MKQRLGEKKNKKLRGSKTEIKSCTTATAHFLVKLIYSHLLFSALSITEEGTFHSQLHFVSVLPVGKLKDVADVLTL